MNIGFFGGTFDPPHMGHLIIAEQVLTELRLDRILFVPSAIPPHKQRAPVSGFEHRYAMVELAIQGNQRFDVSDIEGKRGGVSYTVDTLEELRRLRPEDSWTLLIGTDNLPEFHLWKDPEKIYHLAKVVAMRRPGFPPERMPPSRTGRMLFCPVPEVGIASHTIREKIGRGESVRYLVPDEVERYIREHQLYGSEKKHD